MQDAHVYISGELLPEGHLFQTLPHQLKIALERLTQADGVWMLEDLGQDFVEYLAFA
jgi:hypothetical protein